MQHCNNIQSVVGVVVVWCVVLVVVVVLEGGRGMIITIT